MLIYIHKMNVARAHVFIEGRVQGVFYRASTCNEAGLLNLNGWVRNCSDGRVEAVFEGDKSTVDRMISWCHVGPVGANVKAVKVEWEKTEGGFSGFSVKY